MAFRIGAQRVPPQAQHSMPMIMLRDQFYRIAKDWGISRKANTPLSYIQAIKATAEARISRESKVPRLRTWLATAESTVRHFPFGVSLEFEREFSSTRTHVIKLLNARLTSIPGTPEYGRDQVLKAEEKKRVEAEKKRIESERKLAEAEQLRIKQEQQREREEEMAKLCQPFKTSSLFRQFQWTDLDTLIDHYNKVIPQKIKDELYSSNLKCWLSELNSLSSERPSYFSNNDPFWSKFYWMRRSLIELCSTRILEVEKREVAIKLLCDQLSIIASQWRVDRVDRRNGRAGYTYAVSDIEYIQRIESNRWFFHTYDRESQVQAIIDTAQKSKSSRPAELSSTDPFWIQFSKTCSSIIDSGNARLERIPGTSKYEYSQRLAKEAAEREANQKIRAHERSQKKYYAPMINAISYLDSFAQLYKLPEYHFPCTSDKLDSKDYYKSFSDYFSRLQTDGLPLIKAEKDVKVLTQLSTYLSRNLPRSSETTRLQENTSFWKPYSDTQRLLLAAVKSQLESIPGSTEHIEKQAAEARYAAYKIESAAKEAERARAKAKEEATQSYLRDQRDTQYKSESYSREREIEAAVQRQNQVVAEANYASSQAAQEAASRAASKEARDHYKSAQKARDRIFDEANSGSYPNIGGLDVAAADKALRKAHYRYIESSYS